MGSQLIYLFAGIIYYTRNIYTIACYYNDVFLYFSEKFLSLYNTSCGNELFINMRRRERVQKKFVEAFRRH